MLKIAVFAPPDATDTIIAAMAEAGAGIMGNYSHCAFITSGMGNWKSEEGAHPTIGAVGTMSREPENKIEMLVPEGAFEAVIAAIRRVHPYEEAAIDVMTLLPLPPRLDGKDEGER